jgi:adenylate kinase
MLRAAVAAGTPVGKQAKSIMDRGELVSDGVVVQIVDDRIEQDDARGGFILDGFPRTVAQAEALDQMLASKGIKLDLVIEFRVDETRLVDRIVKRAADALAAGQAVRKDDDPEVFRTRLVAYHNQTAPLVDYYRGRGVLRSIDGMASMDRVTEAIEGLIAEVAATA